MVRQTMTARLLRAALMVGASAIATPALAQAEDDQSIGIQDIVVTAQRREENLQSVPIAVTAFTEDSIRVQRIQNARDLNALAPGLSVQATPGGSQTASFTLRGVNAIGAFAGTSSGVSVYVDGVYIGSNFGAFFDVADIERIEVLRGPQGTLFGRNATGGAISLVTHRPTGEFAVRSENSYGNFDQFRTKTRVDLPALGPLLLSATYLHGERRGDIRNLGAGTQWDYGPATGGNVGIRTSPTWLGNHNTESVSATAVLAPAEGFEFVYKFDYTEDNYTDNGQGMTGIGFGDAQTMGAIGLGQLLYGAQDPALRTPITDRRPDAVNNAFNTGGRMKIMGHSLTATINMTDQITVKNILAYRKTRIFATSQVDGFGFAGTFLPGPLLGGPAGTQLATMVGTSSTAKQHQTSNETQVLIEHDAFNAVAGFFLYDELSRSTPFSNDLGQGVISGLYFFTPTTPGLPATPGQPITIFNTGSLASFVKSRSKAIYFQGSFHVTDQLDFTAGIRQTWDRKVGLDNFSPGLVNNPVDYRGDKATWLLGLDYKPTEDILLYVKASTGFISGGEVGPVTFAPETARSYEAGIKADLFDRRVRTNLAVYRATYKNLQFPTTLSGVNVVMNAGDARAQGVEFEGTFIPFRGLTLNGNIGYLDFKYTRIDPTAVQLGISPTLPLQTYSFVPVNRPKWTASMSAQYESPEVAWGGHFVLRGEANYKSSFFGSFRGYDDNGDGAFNTSDQTYDIIHQSSQWLFNARAALSGIELGGVTAELGVWGKNLTNNRNVQFQTFFGFGHAGSYERARTYGVDLNIEF